MKKYLKHYTVLWVILLALFNVICFVTPVRTEHFLKFAGSFWSGYIGITLAFVGQLIVAVIAFWEGDLQKFFYKTPLITISRIGLILTLIFGSLCMVIPNLPNWVGVIVCFVILGFNALALVKAKIAGDAVGTIDDKLQQSTAFMKNLTCEAEMLISSAADPAIKEECRKVYEALRYSDPVSSPTLTEVETALENVYQAFSEIVHTDDQNAAAKAAADVLSAIHMRNQKCKLRK